MNRVDAENRERRKVRRRTGQNWRATGWQLGSIPWRQEPLWRKLMWAAILIAVVALNIYIAAKIGHKGPSTQPQDKDVPTSQVPQ